MTLGHGSVGSDPIGRRHELEERLREEMLEARREFDAASGKYKSLMHSFDGSNPDLLRSLALAKRFHETAFERYSTALRKFTDLVINGRPPEDTKSRP